MMCMSRQECQEAALPVLAREYLQKGEAYFMEEKKIPVIRVKNLYKIYQVGTNKVYALNGVDFTMYRGEFCASRSVRLGKVHTLKYAGRPGKADKG